MASRSGRCVHKSIEHFVRADKIKREYKSVNSLVVEAVRKLLGADEKSPGTEVEAEGT
ncbi:hypothetical protein HMPREF7215_2765 [Pyramidobacter piscolens W5455]|uniref:Toxin-antitoxin system, antitoxin component, ribbon-helix-helix domain protein n=1 Tax=Pyramidobacter piscolens W5455 TaxID=352165 RepID=A0ABM9ZWR4_9BACT|nr:hypothetical protein HMPREF7215_2765 [Pyramidobacter piscolens W5455]